MREGKGDPRTLQRIYRLLLRRFGRQHWWPGDTPFEVAVGAILTQNTSWSNASRAIQSLKGQRLLDPVSLHDLPTEQLARWIRPSGYYNQKAVRLKAFVGHLMSRYGGSMRRMQAMPLIPLREELLSLPGIGPETADSILLYALEKPAFVVDAYTRRVLARHSIVSWDAPYDEIQRLFMQKLVHRVAYFNEYHALFVTLGKALCRSHPHCSLCPLRGIGELRPERHGNA